jgi:hypothetical protein
MRIENLRTEKRGTRKRIAATVIWEDCDRPVHELFYETEERFADDLLCNPHTFLVACTMPALCHGEKRIFIGEEICPELQEGLKAAMTLVRHWWYQKEEQAILRIEARTSRTILNPGREERAGMFFSGGIDSLSSLRRNRLHFPLEHPWAVKDGLLIFGLETDQEEKFDHVVNSLQWVAEKADLTLIPVYTNVRYLDDDWMFWQHKFQDSVYASVAHAFSRRLSVVSIASTYNYPHMQRDGSHPLLDMHYSSSDLRIRHDSLDLSRLDKMRLVAGWDLGYQNIRTCNRSELYRPGFLNCGECWKCVSARLAFLALGVSEKTRAFPEVPLTEELLNSVIKLYQATICFYDELPGPLREHGHEALARAIERKIEDYEQHQELSSVKSAVRNFVREKVKRFDRRHLKGNLKRYIARRRAGVQAIPGS